MLYNRIIEQASDCGGQTEQASCIGKANYYMSDHADIKFTVCYSNFLTLVYDTKEEVQRAYEIMKEGSTTIYEMEATPYSSCRVVFVDKFGIRWGIMTEQAER